MSVTLPDTRFAGSTDQVRYYEALLDELRGIPGVSAVGGTSSLPLAGDDGDADFAIEGRPRPEPTKANTAWVRYVTTGYFRAMGQRLLEGRPFDDRDDVESDAVVVVNETLARRYFDYPRRTPIGARVTFGVGAPPRSGRPWAAAPAIPGTSGSETLRVLPCTSRTDRSRRPR